MVWRAVHFPLLADFESSAEEILWFSVDRDALRSLAERRRVAGHASHGTRSLRVAVRRGQWPGVRLLCADQDWAGYSVFAFDIQNDEQPFKLSLRIDDALSKDNSNRYNVAITIARGTNHIRIPLAEVASQPSARPLDLHAIRRVVFFEEWSSAEHIYFLDYVRLE
jgi:hypothetical protein